MTVGTTDQALDHLARSAASAAPYQLAGLFRACGHQLGGDDCTVLVADLQQRFLQPLRSSEGEDPPEGVAVVPVEGTLAGRAYQLSQTQTQDEPGGRTRLWLPLTIDSLRLGVLTTTFGEPPGPEQADAFTRLATAASWLLDGKEGYGDTVVRLRRASHLGVAAELHYSVLPPLSFSGDEVTVSAALEPCYEVAGDVIDYSVDDGSTRLAIFDGMGHGLHSAQCAVFTVAAYRSARRSGLGLLDMLANVDEALTTGLGGEVFSTAIIADLDTTSGMLRWVNAGHPFPLLMRDGRVIKVLETEPWSPLGLGYLQAGRAVELGEEQLEPGDMVLLYTDGVVEARSPEGEFFGVERLADLVRTQLAGGLSAPETMRRVVRELLSHHADQLTDDATLLMVQWRGRREQ